MANEIVKVFETTKVEIITNENSEPLFELYSTGMALGQVKKSKGILYPRKDRIDENVKSAEIIPVVHNGQLYISENQIYDLMLEMHTDKVKPFRKWLTNEVLPSIRKTGSYSIQRKQDSYMIEDPVERAERWIEEKKYTISLETKVNEQATKIEEMKPKAEFADTILISETSIKVGTLAKVATKNDVVIGAKRLFAFLRDKKVLNPNNEPYQSFMDRDWFELKESTYLKNGEVQIGFTTYVKPKGQEGIIRLLKKYYTAA